MKNHAHFDALLSDICIGTSAAPTYFPAHNFDTKDSTGRVRKFNLIDGGVAANNPLISLIYVTFLFYLKSYSLKHQYHCLIFIWFYRL